jgi:single-strand DNA-binding protein
MLNKYFAIGYLGQDPELRYSQNGNPFASFSLAIDDSYKGNDGEKVQRTIWMRCTAFGKTAELVNEILAKGARVQVEGSMTVNEWTDRDGNARKDLQLKLQNFTALSPRQGQDRDGGAQAGTQAPAGRRNGSYNGGASAAAKAPAGRRNENEDYGPAFPSEGSGMDDVPF